MRIPYALNPMIDNLHWLGHASFWAKSRKGTVLYFDPYRLKAGLPKADVILVTHDHFDHCSAGDIKAISGADTVVVGPASIAGKLDCPVRIVAVGGKLSVKDIGIETVPAYNLDKQFHPRSAGNLGFVATVDGVRIYHAGDTDAIPEMKALKADVALLPVGGTYTMTAREAAAAAELIKPKLAVPMHFGGVVGSSADAEEFKRLCGVEVRILKPE